MNKAAARKLKVGQKVTYRGTVCEVIKRHLAPLKKDKPTTTAIDLAAYPHVTIAGTTFSKGSKRVSWQDLA